MLIPNSSLGIPCLQTSGPTRKYVCSWLSPVSPSLNDTKGNSGQFPASPTSMAPSMPWPHLHCTAPVSANEIDYPETESIGWNCRKKFAMYPIVIILWLYTNANFYHGPAPASHRKLCDVEECDIAFHINTLRPRHNGRDFADDILKCIFLNENVCIYD